MLGNCNAIPGILKPFDNYITSAYHEATVAKHKTYKALLGHL
jgi:hypothetical protein